MTCFSGLLGYSGIFALPCEFWNNFVYLCKNAHKGCGWVARMSSQPSLRHLPGVALERPSSWCSVCTCRAASVCPWVSHVTSQEGQRPPLLGPLRCHHDAFTIVFIIDFV